jgi:hypothetical protein
MVRPPISTHIINVANNCIELGYFCMILGTLVCGAGGLPQ